MAIPVEKNKLYGWQAALPTTYPSFMENFVCSLFMVWDTLADEGRFDRNNSVPIV